MFHGWWEGFFGLAGFAATIFFVFVLPGLAIAAWRRSNRLERDFAQLRQELALIKRDLRARPPSVEVAATEASAPVEPAQAQPDPVTPGPPQPEPVTIEAVPEIKTPAPEKREPEKRSFERQLGGRVYGWLGGVALALAGIFLVKYSIDQGWLSPAIRVGLGLLFGLALLGAGQWMRVRSGNLAQALTAAAIGDLFAAMFAAVALYDLISPLPAFVILAAITFLAIALSLREGPFVALVGLAGGFLTPIFVSTGEPRPFILFGFLYLMQLGALTLLHKRGWWYQAAIANAGGILWAILLALSGLTEADGSPVGFVALPLFLVMTDLTGIWALEGGFGARRSTRMVWTARGSSIACFLMLAFWLMQTDHALLDWAFLGALSLLHLGAARRWPEQEVDAFIGAAIAVCAYILWLPYGWDAATGAFVDRASDMILVGLALGVPLTLGGWYFSVGARHPTRWAGLATLGSAFLFGGAYWQLRDQEFLFSWPILSAGLAALHLALALRLEPLRRAERRYVGAFALHCLAVAFFIALAIPMQLEKSWVAVAWALEMPMIAFVAKRLDIAWLRKSLWVIGGAVLGGIWFSGWPTGDTLVFNWLLYGLGVPLAGFVISAHLLRGAHEPYLRAALQVGASLIGFGLVSLEIEHFFRHLGATDSGTDFLIHGVQASAWLAIAHLLLYLGDKRAARVLHWAALALGAIAALWVLVLPLGIENPLLAPIRVGATPILNRLLVVYGMPAVLALWLARDLRPRADLGAWGLAFYRLLGGFGLILGFVAVSFLVRQAMQGDIVMLMGHPVRDAELYLYSASWTLYGVGLLVLGVRMQSQPLRYASAAVVLLTIVKAGLVDASDLTGLYRVASFLGLGVALILIGYLYQRILFRKR